MLQAPLKGLNRPNISISLKSWTNFKNKRTSAQKALHIFLYFFIYNPDLFSIPNVFNFIKHIIFYIYWTVASQFIDVVLITDPFFILLAMTPGCRPARWMGTWRTPPTLTDHGRWAMSSISREGTFSSSSTSWNQNRLWYSKKKKMYPVKPSISFI